MDAILGMELPLLVKFVVSFAIVLLLIGAAALLVRKFGGKALIPGAVQRGRRQPRLAVVDTAQVDSRRSLVIVRRDNVEHLLLIGGPTDVLVEANISGTAAAAVREPEVDARTPAVESVAIPRAAVAAPVAPPIEETPVRFEPAISPVPRLDVRAEPVLMPEPWPEPDVRVPLVPAFTPEPAVHANLPEPDVLAEPRQPQVPPAIVPPPIVPPPAIPPLPTAAVAPPVMDEPLARFAQDLDAHRDHVNGQIKPSPPAVQPPQAPAVAAAPPPRPVEPDLSDDQSLADMAQRLEAALRRPLGANGPRAVPQQPQPAAPAPRVSATVSVRQPAPMRRTPTVAPPIPPQPAAARSAAPAVAPAQPQASAEETATYENLQREMASLLGRKPGSS